MERLIKQNLLDYINNPNNILVWDVDGTLCTFAYGDFSINVCKEEDFHEYMETHDVYLEGNAPNVMRTLVNQIASDRNYVCSKVYTETERESKKNFILRNYNIPEENIIFVNKTSDKLRVLEDIFKSKIDNGITRRNIAMIDDTIELLCEIDEHGYNCKDGLGKFTTIHISSFLDVL